MKQAVHIATYQDAAKELKNSLPKVDVPVVVRLGGNRPYPEYPIQINSDRAINNSIDKLKQKKLLLKAGLQTLPLLNVAEYPCVVKGKVRSGGSKVFVCTTPIGFNKAIAKLGYDYYIEPLFKATSEYRFHCTRDEVFFEVKKHKRPEHKDDIIITSKNHFNKREFVKPRLYKQIHTECLKAMAALDLDIACFDVMYNSTNDNKHEFAIAEANTNPELLANTFKAYNEALTKLITAKVAAYQPAEVAPPQAAKPVLRNRELSQAQKFQIIEDLLANNYLVDADDGYVNFKL